MAWAWRGNRRYYYRSVRDGSRVSKEYVGTGPVAEFCAALDAEERAERDATQATWRQQQADMDALDAQMAAWWDTSTALLKAALYTEGYYQHDRGTWRKRRALR
jgi:hypothetical protein